MTGTAIWTKESCHAVALKYRTRAEFRKNGNSAYQSARDRGFLKDICCHMEWARLPKGYWTKERCAAEAATCKTRTEFSRRKGSAYNYALENNWIDEICSHMEVIGNRYERFVYPIADHVRRIAYVGLTFHLSARLRAHRSKSKRLIEAFGKGMKTEVLTGLLSPEDAVHYESFFIDKFTNDGYEMLNKARAGSLGSGLPRQPRKSRAKKRPGASLF